MWRFWVAAAAALAGAAQGQRVPENPCPDIFAYRQQRGVYFGEIGIPYDGSKDLNLAVNISMVGLYQDVKVKLDLLTPADQILNSRVLRYRVNFPFNNIIPKITQIVYNGRIFCYGPSEPVSVDGVTNLWANIIFKINQYTYNFPSTGNSPSFNSPIPSNVNNNFSNEVPYDSFTVFEPPQVVPPTGQSQNAPVSSRPTKVSVEESCGLANDVQTLVLKGDKTVDNEFPWLVAMFHRQGVSYTFQCTSNLITNRHVITAAHCVWFYKAPLIAKEDILLVMGHSDLTHWASTGAVIRTALEVTPHPSYQQGSGHCDVAVIKLNEEVFFKTTIRPICLWSGDSSLKRFAGSSGVVAGWGKSEQARNVVAVPRKVDMPVVSQETCLRSHSDFKNLTSEMTFCAGNRNGSGPCSGDSGAGFIIKRDGRWYLRGLVSTAIKNQDYSCNLNEYIVFSDVAKLEDWVKVVTK